MVARGHGWSGLLLVGSGLVGFSRGELEEGQMRGFAFVKYSYGLFGLVQESLGSNY